MNLGACEEDGGEQKSAPSVEVSRAPDRTRSVGTQELGFRTKDAAGIKHGERGRPRCGWESPG
jgi:hypothetical protein